MTLPITEFAADLLAKDRCEMCSAPALVRFWKAESKSELLFCGHHSHDHEEALLRSGYQVVADQREFLRKNSEKISGATSSAQFEPVAADKNDPGLSGV